MKHVFSFALFILFVRNVLAAPVMNEIYPVPQMGEYEWMEIYNNEDVPLYIEHYYITDLADNRIKLATTTIDPFGFTVATSSSILNNSGDTIFLKNILGEVVAVATYGAGLKNTQSIIRCPDGGDSWFASDQVTAGQSNQTTCLKLTPTVLATTNPTVSQPPSPTLTPAPSPTLTPLPSISYDNIFLSEVMVNPNVGEKEWAEIYNGNDFAVTLSDWYIDDAESSGSSPKKFSVQIPPYGYSVYHLSSMFNNDHDEVRLLDFDKILKDDFEYSSSTQGYTFGRAGDDSDFCLQMPSEGLINNPCHDLSESSPLPTVEPSAGTVMNTPTITKSTSTAKTMLGVSYPVGRATWSVDDNEGSDAGLEGEILGVSRKLQNVDFIMVKSLSFISLSFSLLTLASLLFKMTIIYGKGKKILSSLFSS